MTSMLRSFRSFDYRIWFIGASISHVGTWMQTTAQSWVVLTELTERDAVAMGIAITLQFAPMLLLASVSGWVADHVDRRTVLIVTQSALCALAIIAAVLLLTHTMTLGIMFGLCAALGVVTTFDNPPRQMYVADLVPGPHAANAQALHAASFNVARLIGPATAGIMIVLVGSGWVFAVNAVSFVAMLVSLGVVRTRGKPAGRRNDHPSPKPAGAFRYLAGRPDLVATFVMIFVAATFGMNFAIYASTMAIEFGADADGYGLLASLFGAGALGGALVCAMRARARFDVITGGCVVAGVATGAATLAPSFWTLGACMVVIGAGMVTALVTSNSYVQNTTAPALRGRVLALYLALVQGGMPIGALTLGWVVSASGPRASIAVTAASAIIAAGVGISWRLIARRRGVVVDAPAATTPDDPLREWVDEGVRR